MKIEMLIKEIKKEIETCDKIGYSGKRPSSDEKLNDNELSMLSGIYYAYSRVLKMINGEHDYLF